MRTSVTIVKSLMALGFLVLLFVGYGVWQNNRAEPRPNRAELKHSLVMGVSWLSKHRDLVLDDNNPMLWWMVQQSAVLTNHPVLKDLVAQYRKRYITGKRSPWEHLFDGGADLAMRAWGLEDLPDYNLFILYGVNCSPELAKLDIVKRQLVSSFCDGKPFSPACVTHQMMGFRFMRQRRCGDVKEVDMQLADLRERVLTQLTWDFRVVDVYVQRVLMLVDTGASDRLKPVWIRRVLEAQDSEGGWSDFQPLMPLFGGKSIGFAPRGIDAKSNKAGFHTTAQGVMLMSLLLNSQALN